MDALLHEDAVLEAPWAVTLVREEEQLVVLLSPDQGVDQPGCVTEMNVLVDEPVDKEEGAFDLVNVRHDAALRVALRVVLRPPHVALGVMRIVPIPVRHWSPGDADMEGLRGPSERHGGHVPSVAPSVDGDAMLVCQPPFDEEVHPRLLVLYLKVPHVPLDLRLEVQPPPAAAPVVHLDYQVALGAEKLRAQVCCDGPAVAHRLHMRAPVHGHHGRIRARTELVLVGPEVRGLQGDLIVGGRELNEGRSDEGEAIEPRVLVHEDGSNNGSILQAANIDCTKQLSREQDMEEVKEQCFKTAEEMEMANDGDRVGQGYRKGQSQQEIPRNGKVHVLYWSTNNCLL